MANNSKQTSHTYYVECAIQPYFQRVNVEAVSMQNALYMFLSRILGNGVKFRVEPRRGEHDANMRLTKVDGVRHTKKYYKVFVG